MTTPSREDDPLAGPGDAPQDTSRIRQLAELYLAGKSHLAAPAAVVPPASRPETAQGVLL
jgi:hypothetical protein